MQVNLYATFRLQAHVKNFTLDLPPGATIRQAVDESVARYPALRRHWLDAQGELHAHVHIFLNGEDLALLPNGLATPLQTEDVLDFFPPVAGG